MHIKTRQQAIENEIRIRNYDRLKYLSLIFVVSSIITLYIDFSSFFPWGIDSQKKLQFLDTIFALSSFCAATFLWLNKDKLSKISQIICVFTVIFLLCWSAFVSIVDFSSFSFSTYTSALILVILFLNLKPAFGLFVIWASAFLLIFLIVLTDQFTEGFIPFLYVLFSIIIILSIVSVTGYREQVTFWNGFFEVEELTKQLKGARDNLQDEVDRQTKELVLAKEKAESSDRLKSALLLNISHEIRTPMNGILGFRAILEEQDFSKDDRDEFISMIKLSSERFLNTLDDIICISQIHTGGFKDNLSEIEVSSKLMELHAEFLPSADEKGLDLIFDYPKNSKTMLVKTDSAKFLVILQKLIQNAIKFTHTGSVRVDLGLNGEGKKSELEISISDTGIGIPENRIPSIFNSFEKGDIEDLHAYEGCGLGLAIAKGYLDCLGGRIEVESELEKGSIFRVYFPMFRDS